MLRGLLIIVSVPIQTTLNRVGPTLLYEVSSLPELKEIPIAKISIPDVRVSSILNDEQKAFMASTVKQIGVVQDIVVRTTGIDQYELVAGNRVCEGVIFLPEGVSRPLEKP